MSHGRNVGVGLCVLAACAATTPDGGSDAHRTDAASNRDAANPDGAPTDGPTPDAAADAGIPPDAVTLSSALLVTDTGLDLIYLLALDGTVLDSWPSPVAGPSGVAFDRRSLDGFWVHGAGVPSVVYKVGWDGATITTRTNPWAVVGAPRGLDFYFDPTAIASDTLVVAHDNVNSLEVISGFRVSDGAASFQSGFHMGGFQGGFWGVHVVEWIPGTRIRTWVSRYATDEIERWSSATWEAEYPIAVTEARGLTMAPDGDFYVVDDATDTVVHLSSTGTTLGSFATPGAQPAGLSFGIAAIIEPIP